MKFKFSLDRLLIIFALTLCSLVSASGAGWPDKVFAPYMYIGADDNFKLTECDDACGQKFYTLAFIIADKEGAPAWDGRFSTDQNLYADQIALIRARGGDVIVSFGGEGGTELALAETNAPALQAKYQSVVDRYKLTWLDFDIEGDALFKTAANARRNAVLSGLQAKNPGLKISYTLPVDPNGISRDSQALLADAKAKGVKVWSANVMTMDFGAHFSRGKKMSDVAIASALKAHEQCQAIDPAIQMGLTPMIGQNDERGEIFTLDDARALKQWADGQPWVCSLSFWASNRDTGKPGKRKNGNTASGLEQKPWDFTLIFEPFTAGDANALPGSSYHIYAGNTHSHTAYTWSHGEQWVNLKAEAGEAKERLRVTPEGVQSPPAGKVLKPDWQKFQGPPSAHFSLAKSNGYDFYIVTDHSQEAAFNPVSPTNSAWLDTKRAAAEATESRFIGLAGYEHSENNGPGGVGHLNVINSAEYLNALAPGIDLKYLYHWLETAPPNGEGPVVVSFNHPGPHQYNDWDYRDPQITDIITMLEVINSNKAGHYAGFVNALDKGWKVSPVCGNDNHGFWGISHHSARTFLLATNLTKAALLEAMKHRRTYAALDKNIQCRYTVNGAIMGSTLDRPAVFNFDIYIRAPDAGQPKEKITKIDIVGDGGGVAQTFNPEPDYVVRWTPTINNGTNKYFFVRVWNAGGGDIPGADPVKPMAWLAPVWTGR